MWGSTVSTFRWVLSHWGHLGAKDKLDRSMDGLIDQGSKDDFVMFAFHQRSYPTEGRSHWQLWGGDGPNSALQTLWQKWFIDAGQKELHISLAGLCLKLGSRCFSMQQHNCIDQGRSKIQPSQSRSSYQYSEGLTCLHSTDSAWLVQVFCRVQIERIWDEVDTSHIVPCLHCQFNRSFYICSVIQLLHSSGKRLFGSRLSGLWISNVKLQIDSVATVVSQGWFASVWWPSWTSSSSSGDVFFHVAYWEVSVGRAVVCGCLWLLAAWPLPCSIPGFVVMVEAHLRFWLLLLLDAGASVDVD